MGGMAVNKGHTYLALQLLEKGASLTPEAGEALGEYIFVLSRMSMF